MYHDKRPEYFSQERLEIVDLPPGGIERVLNAGCWVDLEVWKW